MPKSVKIPAKPAVIRNPTEAAAAISSTTIAAPQPSVVKDHLTLESLKGGPLAHVFDYLPKGKAALKQRATSKDVNEAVLSRYQRTGSEEKNPGLKIPISKLEIVDGVSRLPLGGANRLALAPKNAGEVSKLSNWYNNLEPGHQKSLTFKELHLNGEGLKELKKAEHAPFREALNARLELLKLTKIYDESDEELAEICGAGFQSLKSLDLSDTKASSKTAQAIASNPGLLRTLSDVKLSSIKRLTDEEVTQFCRSKFQSLSTISLNKSKGSKQTAQAISGNPGLLRTLEYVKMSEFIGLNDNDIAQFFKSDFQSLAYLSLGGTRASKKTAQAIASNPGILRTLSAVDMKRFTGLNDVDISQFCCADFQSLKSLDLSHTKAGDQTAKAIRGNEGALRTLTHLYMAACKNLKDEDLAVIFSGGFQSLVKMDLMNCDTGTKTAKAIAGNPGLLKTLPALDLSQFTGLKDADLAQVFSAGFKSLLHFNLVKSKAGIKTAQAIANNPSILQTLTDLDVSCFTGLNDGNLAELLSARFQSLSTISLDGSSAGKGSAQAIAGNDGVQKTLSSLSMDNCSEFSEADLAQIFTSDFESLSAVCLERTHAGQKTALALSVRESDTFSLWADEELKKSLEAYQKLFMDEAPRFDRIVGRLSRPFDAVPFPEKAHVQPVVEGKTLDFALDSVKYNPASSCLGTRAYPGYLKKAIQVLVALQKSEELKPDQVQALAYKVKHEFNVAMRDAPKEQQQALLGLEEVQDHLKALEDLRKLQ